MTALESCGRFDPAVGRLPGVLAHALFRGDDWLATSSLSITAALEAPCVRIGAEHPHRPGLRLGGLPDLGPGSAAVWYPDARDRIRLPTRPELLVRFVTDMLGWWPSMSRTWRSRTEMVPW